MLEHLKISLTPGGIPMILPGMRPAHDSDKKFLGLFNASWVRAMVTLSASVVMEDNSHLEYWQRITSDCVKSLLMQCHANEALRPPTEDASAILLEKAPIDAVWEQLTPKTLHNYFTALCAALTVDGTSAGLRRYFQLHFPEFLDLGRIHLHIAEKEQEGVASFLLLVTVADHFAADGQCVHVVAGEAMQSSLTAGRQDFVAKIMAALAGLCAAVPRAAQALSQGAMFRPLPLETHEVAWIIQNTQRLAASGVLVKVPRSWQEGRRFRRGALAVRIQEGSHAGSSRQGASLRLDFSLAGFDLSTEELEAILSRQEQLLFLKNQWVYIDRENLQSIVSRLRAAQVEAASGRMSLPVALRWLARIPASLGSGSSSAFEMHGQDGAPAGVGAVNDETGHALLCLEHPGLASLMAETATLTTPDRDHLRSTLRAALRPYQTVGVAWLRLRQKHGLGACLADDMGLGKTLQTIAFLILSTSNRSAGRNSHLIICPPSLISNWLAECERFAPGMQVLAARLGTELPAPDHSEVPDVIITSYHLVRGRLDWFRQHAWDCIVLDEAQHIKNPLSQTALAVRSLEKAMGIAVTGTPVENTATDLWSLFDFIMPGHVGPLQEFNGLVNDHAKRSRLKATLHPFILRRLKTDPAVIQDLPAKNILRIHCRLSRGQAVAYDRIIREFKQKLQAASGSSNTSLEGDAAANGRELERRRLILPTLMNLKQVCIHADFHLRHRIGAIEPGEKLGRMLDIIGRIQIAGEKCLVFTQFASLLPALTEILTALPNPLQVFCFEGGMSQADRDRSLAGFRAARGCAVMLISLKAGGVGLNLTEANHVLHLDRWWNPAVENQATDRAFRIGQAKPVFVYLLINADTIERGIDRMLSRKEGLAADLLDPDDSSRLLEGLNDGELITLMERADAAEDDRDSGSIHGLA